MTAGIARLLDPTTRARLHGVELLPRGNVGGYLAGNHRSSRTGFSVEFAGHRAYVPGDDSRRIDWKALSRTERLYTKQFHEETRLTLHVLVDASRSMAYRSEEDSKLDYARRLAMALAYIVTSQRDEVDVAAYTDGLRKYGLRGSSPATLDQLARRLEQERPEGVADFSKAARRFAEAEPGRSHVVAIISDLLAEDPDRFGRGLHNLTSRGHEAIVFQVLHKDEVEFPFTDTLRFRGLEGEPDVHANGADIRQRYLDLLDRHVDRIRARCRALSADHVLARTDVPPWAYLREYFLRQRR